MNAIKYIFLNVVIFFMYNTLMFKCIYNFGYFESRLILLLILISCGLLIKFSRVKTDELLIKAGILALPYGLYTVIAYLNVCKLLSIGLSVLGAILFILSSLFVLMNTNKGRLRKLVAGLIVVMIISMTPSLVIVLAATMTGITLPLSVEETITEHKNVKLEDNLDELSVLVNGEFGELDLKEKRRILQLVADIECTYLGLDTIVVKVEPMKEYVLGAYDDKKKVILINGNHLDSSYGADGELWIKTIAHESYHAYEYELIRAYDSAPNKSLRIFKDCDIMQQELCNYTSGEEDVEAYQNQVIEKKSVEYADLAWKEYSTRITEFLNVKN